MRLLQLELTAFALALASAHSEACPQVLESAIVPLATQLDGNPASAGELWIGGDELLVASPFEDEVLRFERLADGSWSQVSSIFSIWSDGGVLQLFGASISIDGSRAAFAQTQYFEGGVALYTRDTNGDWQPDTIIGPLPGASNQFANRIALSENRLMIADSSAGSGGVVYAGDEVAPGNWQFAQLEPTGGGVSFGRDEIVFAGNQVLIGDSLDDQFGFQSGAVYVFEESGTGSWAERQKLTASDATSAESFGSSIAVSGDTAVIGAAFSDSLGNGSGAAYVFERQADGTWLESQKLLPSDLEPGDTFGNDVAIQGELLLVGAAEKDDAGSDAGAVYVFQRQLGTWVQIQKLFASDASNNASFGHRLHLSSDRAVISLQSDPAVYVLDPNLLASPTGLSLTAGGNQTLDLQAGSEHSGELYLVLGSATGSVPGLAVAPVFLPLNWDAYSALSLQQAGQGIFQDTLGFLDPSGTGTARIQIPPLSNPALAGLELRHAFLTITLLGQVSFASNATSLQLLP